jgi:VWFA-related protein
MMKVNMRQTHVAAARLARLLKSEFSARAKTLPCLVVVTLLALSPAVAPAEAEPHPGSDRVCVEVRSKTGDAVTGLGAGMFQVALAGRSATVSSSIEDAPLSVMVLLDVSYPALPYQEELQRSLDRFAADLRPQDEMAVMVFGASTSSLFAFTNDHLDTRRKALSYQFQAAAANNAFLWDGLAAAVASVGGRQGRRAVVVFTNGLDTGSKTSRQEALDAALHSGVRLDFIHTPRPSAWSGGFWRQQISQLDGAAADTGGTVIKVRDSEDLQPAFTALAAGLMKGYCLSLTVPSLDRDRKLVKLEIKTDTKGARVRGPSRIAAGEN